MVTLTNLLLQVWRRVLAISASGSAQLNHRVRQMARKKEEKIGSTACCNVKRWVEVIVKILCNNPVPTADQVKPVQPANIIEPAFANGQMPNFICHDHVQRCGAILIADICKFFTHGWVPYSPVIRKPMVQ